MLVLKWSLKRLGCFWPSFSVARGLVLFSYSVRCNVGGKDLKRERDKGNTDMATRSIMWGQLFSLQTDAEPARTTLHPQHGQLVPQRPCSWLWWVTVAQSETLSVSVGCYSTSVPLPTPSSSVSSPGWLTSLSGKSHFCMNHGICRVYGRRNP